MKTRLVVLLALSAALLAPTCPATAADTPDAKTQLQELVGKIQTKLKEGKPTEESLADELKQFDAILASHAGEKTADVANVLFMKAMLYEQVLGNQPKAIEELTRLSQDFPDTPQAEMAASTMKGIEKRAQLATGKPFPDFNEKDLDGQPLSVSKYKGKVVLVDFWATWCGPCIHEMPNVQAAYKKHHDAGFEIIGISLDSDRAKLTAFLKDKEIPWKQYFDGQGWKTKLAQEYGVNSIPATYLLDRKGLIIGSNLRGEALEQAVAKALETKE